MKNATTAFRIVAAFLVAGCLSACDFDQPLSSRANRSVDQRFVGAWGCKDEDDTIRVQMGAGENGLLVGRSWSDNEPKNISEFEAWTDKVSGQTFMTIDLGTGEYKRYIYARITWKDGGAQYEQVRSDSSFAKDAKGATIDRLKRHLNDSDLFGPAKMFYR